MKELDVIDVTGVTLPWWIRALAFIPVLPILPLMLLALSLEALARGVQWLCRDRSWVKPFLRASDRIESWGYRRAIVPGHMVSRIVTKKSDLSLISQSPNQTAA